MFLQLFVYLIAGLSPLTKRVTYEVSLLYTCSRQSEWWNQIETLPLYLGALPLYGNNHHRLIEALNVTHVISVVEDFELEEGWFHKPVNGKDWCALGIEHLQIPAEDFKPLSRSQIERGVILLTVLLERNQIVYIHCKAGVGRSATIVVAYLARSGHTLEEAYAIVSNARPRINLNEAQRAAILDYITS